MLKVTFVLVSTKATVVINLTGHPVQIELFDYFIHSFLLLLRRIVEKLEEI